VEVLDRGVDGHPIRVRMTMHIARGGFVREFNLFLAIVIEPPGSVRLTRVTDHPTNQKFNATWTLRLAASTRIALELDAKLRVPWYIRAGGIGDAIAKAFVGAACRRLSTIIAVGHRPRARLAGTANRRSTHPSGQGGAGGLPCRQRCLAFFATPWRPVMI
jgi:hypothetical protein